MPEVEDSPATGTIYQMKAISTVNSECEILFQGYCTVLLFIIWLTDFACCNWSIPGSVSSRTDL